MTARTRTWPGAWFGLLLIVAGPVAARQATAPSVEGRFIANAGFVISDGETTILVDFPYRSGAFGYMEYDDNELEARDNALCVFTHRHADHFDAGLIERLGCSVAGSPEVLGLVDARQRAGSGPEWEFGSASIRCVESVHSNVDHCSYVIDWHGTAIYVAGDVEELSALAQVEHLDVAVIPAWLSPQVGQIRQRFPQARIVITHHTASRDLSGCDDCLVPAPGEPIVW